VLKGSGSLKGGGWNNSAMVMRYIDESEICNRLRIKRHRRKKK
jgi:hypothetical protein